MTESNTTEVTATSEHPIAYFINTVAEGFRPDYPCDRESLGNAVKGKSSRLRNQLHVWGSDLSEIA
jgi:hypothetical protein